MKTNKELLKIALKHVGEGGKKFRRFCGLGSGQPWCNAYVDYIADEGGVSKLYFNGKKETYCPHSMKWCEKNLAQVPLYLAMPMDPIYFDWEKNRIPNHIGFVRARKSTTEIRTIEGNTNGGKVAKKTRPADYVQAIFRPHFEPPKKQHNSRLGIDGDFGFHTIYMLQVVLGVPPTGILTKDTVKKLQAKVGASQDGAWGKKTSLAVQRWISAKEDGEFGEQSVRRLQKKINSLAFPTEVSAEPTPAEKAVEWGRMIAKDGSYKYKLWKDKDKKTHLCPVCHPELKGKYHAWQCIGYVTACYFHGAGLRCIKCECNGLGTNKFFTNVTEESWRKRNGKNWKMITNGGSKGGKSISLDKLKAGDVLICYDSKGVFHHLVMYSGNGMYLECTRGRKPQIAERPMSKLSKKHITRAFRYTGE